MLCIIGNVNKSYNIFREVFIAATDLCSIDTTDLLGQIWLEYAGSFILGLPHAMPHMELILVGCTTLCHGLSR